MKIGLVDLDTSHPEHWVPIERELGHEVVGAWDGGSVHPPDYVQRFAETHQIPTVFRSLEEMAGAVQCAIIHSCDWDVHVERARPFVEAGRAVLVDKPIAGNLADLNQFRKWFDDGARITGGSSLRFCAEVQRLHARDETQHGVPHTVFCGCGVDEFNYGIHAYSLLHGIMGGGAASVRHVEKRVQRRVEVTWADGRTGILMIGRADKWLPSYASIVTDRDAQAFVVDVSAIYRAFLEVVLPYLAGSQTDPPISASQWLEPELWALAAKASWDDGDRPVRLDELTDRAVSYDGSAFAREYRASRYH